MFETVRIYRIATSRVSLLAAGVALLILASSCTKPQSMQRTFASPEDAGAALLAAAKSADQSDLIRIFGPNAGQLLLTDDPGANKANLQGFVSAYGRMHRWRPIQAGGQVLLIGAGNYPFPIPLGQNSSGRWYFDTAAGKDEILARRIGKNELTAMDASKAIAGAQQGYYQEKHDRGQVKEYAQKFVSDRGMHNGLYWPDAEGQPPSPLGQLSAFTKVLSTTGDTLKPLLFNGYYYRILTKGATPSGIKDYIVNGRMTGGFAILAYPSEYRNTGIMSFIIGEDGALYQKDFGEKTAEIAATLTAVNPHDGWNSVDTPPTVANRVRSLNTLASNLATSCKPGRTHFT